MIDKERGLQLLGNGLGPAEVATTLGCDPSFVSQWLMDEAFRAKVLQLRMQNLQAQTMRDRKIDSLEDTILEKLERDILPYLTKTRDVLQAFQLLNAAKRRGASAAGSIDGQQSVVKIVMPPVAREYFFPKVNAQGEVVQVGQTVTITKSLQQLMQERVQKKLTAQDAEVLHETTRAANASPAGPTIEREEAAA